MIILLVTHENLSFLSIFLSSSIYLVGHVQKAFFITARHASYFLVTKIEVRCKDGAQHLCRCLKMRVFP